MDSEFEVEYYDNGNKKIEMNEEIIREYYKSGELKSEYLKDKEYKSYYQNGDLKEKCTLVNMSLHGWLNRFDEKGKEQPELLYNLGVKIGHPFFR